jgi:hypothetical protein
MRSYSFGQGGMVFTMRLKVNGPSTPSTAPRHGRSNVRESLTVECPVGAWLFGKMPAHGDFISRWLEDDAVAAGDAVIAEALAMAAHRWDSEWDEVYVETPVWRFMATPESLARPGRPESSWPRSTPWAVNIRSSPALPRRRWHCSLMAGRQPPR